MNGGAKEALYEQEPDELQVFVWLLFGGGDPLPPIITEKERWADWTGWVSQSGRQG